MSRIVRGGGRIQNECLGSGDETIITVLWRFSLVWNERKYKQKGLGSFRSFGSFLFYATISFPEVRNAKAISKWWWSPRSFPDLSTIHCSRNLRNTNLSSFERLYDRIYAKHNTGDRVKYCLSREALDVYASHMDDNQTQQGEAANGHSKDDKNIIRLVAVMHVLYTVIDQALNQRTDDISKKITFQIPYLSKRDYPVRQVLAECGTQFSVFSFYWIFPWFSLYSC